MLLGLHDDSVFAAGAWQLRSCRADGLQLLHLLDRRLPASDLACPVSVAGMAALLDLGLRCTALPGSCRPSMAEACAALQQHVDRLEALQLPRPASVVPIGSDDTVAPHTVAHIGPVPTDHAHATGCQHACDQPCGDCVSSQRSESSGSHCSLDPLNP